MNIDVGMLEMCVVYIQKCVGNAYRLVVVILLILEYKLKSTNLSVLGKCICHTCSVKVAM